MSLAIDTDQVTAVLLADGWHQARPGTFDLDSYEYLYWPLQRCKDHDDPVLSHGGGNSGVCSTGFRFDTADGIRISGPLTAILAVEHTVDACFRARCGHGEEAAA